jgi:hypothetical protein
MECSVEGCSNTANVPGSARGLCRAHYRRWQRYGTEHEPLRRMKSWAGEICTETDCDKPVVTNGFCENHYKVARRRNNPEAQAIRNKAFKARTRANQEQLMGRPRPMFCELCQQEGYNLGRKPSIVFDHDHATGLSRGWLCDRCNKALGLVKDSTSLLRKMIQYLETSNGATYNQTAECVANESICRTGKVLSNSK